MDKLSHHTREEEEETSSRLEFTIKDYVKIIWMDKETNIGANILRDAINLFFHYHMIWIRGFLKHI